MIRLLLRKINALINIYFWKKFHSSSNKSIIINSIPKSGTHLADQFFKNIDEVKDFSFFIAQAPTRPHRLRSENKIIELISRIKPGEIVRGHFHYSKKIEELLIQKEILMIFVYRDPRDVIISEANYLYDMNKFHSLHKYFRHKHVLKDRIKLSIKGINSIKFGYKNVGERLKPYIGWKINKSDHIFSMNYESMRNSLDLCIEQLYLFFKKNNFFEKEISLQNFSTKVNQSIDPKKSHTFRKGKDGGWKNQFDLEIINLYKDYEDGITENLGYEMPSFDLDNKNLKIDK
tara:strand:- start:1845 stop:2711 length:867 start_codon:yes stop_codon:yes gene_type:complete